jgi:hypothetical protein
MGRVYHLNWELNWVYPFPQIYKETYVYKWYNARWYTYVTYGRYAIIQGAMTECGDADCLNLNFTTRLIPRLDEACTPDTLCIVDWAPFSCAHNPCPELPPTQGWQGLLDMVSSPYTPQHNLNPGLPRQSALPRGVSDIKRQPILP